MSRAFDGVLPEMTRNLWILSPDHLRLLKVVGLTHRFIRLGVIVIALIVGSD